MSRSRLVFVFVLIVLVMGVALFSSLHTISVVKKDAERHKGNTEILLKRIDTFRTRNGELVAKVASLELKKREMDMVLEEDTKLINSLRRSNERLDKMVKTSTESKVEVKTVVKDSVIYVREGFEKVEVIEWEDPPWESFSARIYEGNAVDVKMTHKDKIDVLVFLEYRKFLWWKTKVKGCNVDVVSHNPYTTGIDVSSVSLVR